MLNLSHLKPPVVRPNVVAHSSQKTDVPHRRPVDVVEWSILKRLEFLEFIFARPALGNNQSRLCIRINIWPRNYTNEITLGAV